MPIYQCICPEGLLDESARGKLAEEITRIHCDATGVPPAFVNVMFLDVPDGRYFVAGKPSGHSVLNAAIRVGRDLQTRQRILRELSQTWTRLTGQAGGRTSHLAVGEPGGERDGSRTDLPGTRPGTAVVRGKPRLVTELGIL